MMRLRGDARCQEDNMEMVVGGDDDKMSCVLWV
jgi:hypothetical protein